MSAPPLAFSTALLGVVIVVASMVVATLGFWLVYRRFDRDRLKENNEVGGMLFAMIGVLYTVLLAFMVIVVWDQFENARAVSDGEVTRLSNLLRDAHTFPAPARDRIELSIVKYAATVVDSEWKTMESGKASPVAYAAYNGMWNAYYALKPVGNQEGLFYQESLSRLNEVGQYRRERLLAARDSFPTLLWILLIAGAVVTIAYTWVLGTSQTLLHAVSVAVLAGLTALVLFLILALNHPFSGEVRVTPESFQQLYAQWAPLIGHNNEAVPTCTFC